MEPLSYIENRLLLPDPGERESVFRHDPRLRELLPEVYRLETVLQSPEYHPEGDALTHSLLAVRHLPVDCDRRLAWAALLHDIGKAVTTREIEGRLRAFGHDRKGAEMAEKILLRLGMVPQERIDIAWLIRHHMFALSWRVDKFESLSRRQRRFLCDSRFSLLIDLMEIDAKAALNSPDKLTQVEFYRRAWALTAKASPP